MLKDFFYRLWTGEDSGLLTFFGTPSCCPPGMTLDIFHLDFGFYLGLLPEPNVLLEHVELPCFLPFAVHLNISDTQGFSLNHELRPLNSVLDNVLLEHG